MSLIKNAVTYTRFLLRALICEQCFRFSVDCGGICKDLPCTVIPKLVFCRILCSQSLQFLKVKLHLICNFLSLSETLTQLIFIFACDETCQPKIENTSFEIQFSGFLLKTPPKTLLILLCE